MIVFPSVNFSDIAAMNDPGAPAAPAALNPNGQRAPPGPRVTAAA